MNTSLSKGKIMNLLRQIVHYPDQPLEVERAVSGSQAVVSGSQAGGYVQGTTTYTTSTVPAGQVQYVSGQSGAQYVSGGQQVYTTGGQTTYTTTTTPVVYTTGGQTTYTTTTNPVVYNTGPVQTTYEYVNAPSSSTYVDQQGVQRWESSVPYAERGTYEYVTYPEGAYVTQPK